MSNRRIILFGLVLFLFIIWNTSFEITLGYDQDDWQKTCTHDNFDYTKGYYREATCVSYGRTFFPCKEKGCNGVAVFYNAKPINHIFGIKGRRTVHEPTCTEGGYTEIECILCWKYQREDEKPPLGHDIQLIDKPATCTEEGLYQVRCNRCKITFTKEKREKLGHDYKETIVPQTCVADGYICDQCTRCGEVIPGSTITLESTGTEHNYNWFVKEEKPTCTKPGKIIKRCSICRKPNATWTLEYAPDPTKNHVLPEQRTGYRKPTCENPGYDVFRCKECNYEEIRNEVPELGGDHIWVDEKVITKATCGSNGEMRQKCTRCVDIRTVPIPATNKHVDRNKNKKCDNCGASMK